MTERVPIQKQIILTCKEDWPFWYPVTQSVAVGLGIKDLVLPEADLPLGRPEPTIRIRAPYPTPRHIRPSASTILQLDKDEREIYKLLIEDWKNEEALYKEEATALAQFRLHLATTIAINIFTPLSTKDLSLYGMMKELKEEYSPTTMEQQEDVMRRYYALKRFPKGRDLCEWIDDWIQIEKDLKEAKCFEWGLILKDFQEIQHQVDHGYASTFEREIDDGKIAFEDLAKRYRRYYKKNSYKPHSSRSTFQATLNDQGVNEPTNETPTAQGNGKKNSEIRPCVCGKKHRFSTCFYLLPHLRPDGWQEDPEVRRKINDTLSKNERLRKGVEKAV